MCMCIGDAIIPLYLQIFQVLRGQVYPNMWRVNFSKKSGNFKKYSVRVAFYEGK